MWGHLGFLLGNPAECFAKPGKPTGSVAHRSIKFSAFTQEQAKAQFWIGYSDRLQGVPDSCARLHANCSEVWRTLANPQRHIHENLPDIHQSSGEGSPTFTRVPGKVPSVCGCDLGVMQAGFQGLKLSLALETLEKPAPWLRHP